MASVRGLGAVGFVMKAQAFRVIIRGFCMVYGQGVQSAELCGSGFGVLGVRAWGFSIPYSPRTPKLLILCRPNPTHV